jgi:hypothetical protein
MELEQEKSLYAEEKLQLDEQLDKLNILASNLSVSQNSITNILSSNLKLLDRLNEFSSESKDCQKSFANQCRDFRALQSSLLNCIQQNFEQTKKNIECYSNLNNTHKQDNEEAIVEKLFQHSLFKSKSFLFDEVLQTIVPILKPSDTETSGLKRATNSGKNLQQILNKCQEKEGELMKYASSINESLKECKKRMDTCDLVNMHYSIHFNRLIVCSFIF